MPLPVDIDVGDANASPASRIQPHTGGQLKVVQAGRPAQRAAEDAWLRPHRTLQEVPQPTRAVSRIGRNAELSLGAWLLGLVSLACMFVGTGAALVGAWLGHESLAGFGIWTGAFGVACLALLILRSDRS
jgi:hypothetical protein